MSEQYRAHFQIEAHTAAVADTVRTAVGKRFNGPAFNARSGQWDGIGQTVAIDESDHDGLWAFRLQWTLGEGSDGYRIDLRAAQAGGPIEFLALIHCDSPNRRRPRRLDVVSELIAQHQCKQGSTPLSLQAEAINLDQIASFTDSVLLHPERRLPIVALSRDRDGTTAHPPDEMQHNLAGRAQVVVWDSEVSSVLSEQIGRQFACYGGAIRIYRPGASESDRAGHHRFFLKSQAVGRRFIDNLVQHLESVQITDGAEERITEIEERVRRARREALSRQVVELSQALRQQQSMTDRQIAASQETLDAQRGRIEELERENARLRGQLVQRDLSRAADPEPPFPEVDIDAAPQSVLEALQIAEERCSNLRFFGSAQRSAEESRYLQPGQVFDALRALDQAADEIRTGALSEANMIGTLSRRGYETSTESTDTMRRFGDLRRFHDYDRRLIEMQPHIKLGGGSGADSHVRIHFAWDDESDAIVIGHVGRHLRTGRE